MFLTNYSLKDGRLPNIYMMAHLNFFQMVYWLCAWLSHHTIQIHWYLFVWRVKEPSIWLCTLSDVSRGEAFNVSCPLSVQYSHQWQAFIGSPALWTEWHWIDSTYDNLRKNYMKILQIYMLFLCSRSICLQTTFPSSNGQGLYGFWRFRLQFKNAGWKICIPELKLESFLELHYSPDGGGSCLSFGNWDLLLFFATDQWCLGKRRLWHV